MFAVRIVHFLGKTPRSTYRKSDGSFCKPIASATDSLGKYSHITTAPYRQQAMKAVRRKGESKLMREEEKSRLIEQDVKGQVHTGCGDFGQRQRCYTAERSWHCKHSNILM